MRPCRYKAGSLLMLMLFLLIEGCAQKELNDGAHTTIADKVDVVFDWSRVADPQASTMVLYLYPEEHEMMDYRFNNPAGGTIRTYGGRHTAICHSNDDPYLHLLRNEHSHDAMEIYTDNSVLLVGQGISTRGLPRAEGTEDEPLRITPSMIYGTHDRDVRLKVSGLTQTLTLYPEELVCHYTVEFVNVENLDNADMRIDATISSLAGGCRPGSLTTTSEAVSHTFTLVPDLEQKTLRSEFLTFGVPEGGELPHMICLYIALKDKTGGFYTFDVSDQVNKAPDPRNVTITIPGLKLPEIVIPELPPGTTGMTIEIDTWDTYYYNVKV